MNKLWSVIQVIRLLMGAAALVLFILLGLAFAYAAIMYAVTRSDRSEGIFWAVMSTLSLGLAFAISRGVKTLLLSLGRRDLKSDTHRTGVDSSR